MSGPYREHQVAPAQPIALALAQPYWTDYTGMPLL